MQCLQTGEFNLLKVHCAVRFCGERLADKPPPLYLSHHPEPNLLLSDLLSHWVLMNLQFGAKTGNPPRLKEEYEQISSGDNE